MKINSKFSIFLKLFLKNSWPMPPAIVNAAYEPTQNSISESQIHF
jgi:predicted metalloendopeptidase